MTCHARATNRDALGFYERIGFEIRGASTTTTRTAATPTTSDSARTRLRTSCRSSCAGSERFSRDLPNEVADGRADPSVPPWPVRRSLRQASVTPPPAANEREWGFIPWTEGPGETMVRHRSLLDLGEIEDFLGRRKPRHVYFSAGRYDEPSASTMSDKGWRSSDLVFDLDADHLPSVVLGEDGYAEMLATCKDALRRLLDLRKTISASRSCRRSSPAAAATTSTSATSGPPPGAGRAPGGRRLRPRHRAGVRRTRRRGIRRRHGWSVQSGPERTLSTEGGWSARAHRHCSPSSMTCSRWRRPTRSNNCRSTTASARGRRRRH